MDKKEIKNFSLSQLIDICGLRPEDLYHEGCLIASKVNMADEIDLNMFRYPMRMNAYAIAFCSKGSISITSNLNHYTLTEQMLYINLPGTFLQIESMDNAEVYLIICEEEFIRRINVDLKLLSRLFLRVERHPALKLDNEDWHSVMRSFDEISYEGEFHNDDVYSTEVIRTALRMIIYKVCRIIAHHVSATPTEIVPSPRNRNEEYFHRFMRILSQNYHIERSVGFYSRQLNLTPKYFTTIIRKTSGRTAVSWIDDFVILEAKNLLKYSSMSIQEISYYLNFPNQSFFGKYFKSHTGMTPTAYRSTK